MRIGIMGAMPEEISLLREQLVEVSHELIGQRAYLSGKIHGIDVVVVFSRWGKVAASSTATTLIDRFAVTHVVFTGVAGAIAAHLNVGDVVIASECVQHDMDASAIPGIERFEIPLLGHTRLFTDPRLRDLAVHASAGYLADEMPREISQTLRDEFSLEVPRVHAGIIASGDQFISDRAVAQQLAEDIPDLLCVEMEGAAVAQVAFEHDVPCILVRVISDKADHSAAVDFPIFVSKIASHFTCGVVLRLLKEDVFSGNSEAL